MLVRRNTIAASACMSLCDSLSVWAHHDDLVSIHERWPSFFSFVMFLHFQISMSAKFSGSAARSVLIWSDRFNARVERGTSISTDAIAKGQVGQLSFWCPKGAWSVARFDLQHSSPWYFFLIFLPAWRFSNSTSSWISFDAQSGTFTGLLKKKCDYSSVKEQSIKTLKRSRFSFHKTPNFSAWFSILSFFRWSRFTDIFQPHRRAPSFSRPLAVHDYRQLTTQHHRRRLSLHQKSNILLGYHHWRNLQRFLERNRPENDYQRGDTESWWLGSRLAE